MPNEIRIMTAAEIAAAVPAPPSPPGVTALEAARQAMERTNQWHGRQSMRRDLWAARGRAHKLTFFIHDCMYAGCLDCERIDACVFMVATAEGPLSMCLHNAKRDELILKPIRMADAAWWDPLTGRTDAAPDLEPGRGARVGHTRKTLKGRLKEAAP